MKRVEVTVYYLEMTDPRQLRPPERTPPEVAIRHAAVALPEFNRFLYTAVGADWYWLDRLGWRYQDWLDWLGRPGVETWVAYFRDTPAGYYELSPKPAGNIDIAYFGLLPRFIGQGLGGALLAHAVERAWKLGPNRITLNTCSLDHHAALANYQARGFRIYREASEIRSLPDAPTGPWPGAGRAAS